MASVGDVGFNNAINENKSSEATHENKRVLSAQARTISHYSSLWLLSFPGTGLHEARCVSPELVTNALDY